MQICLSRSSTSVSGNMSNHTKHVFEFYGFRENLAIFHPFAIRIKVSSKRIPGILLHIVNDISICYILFQSIKFRNRTQIANLFSHNIRTRIWHSSSSITNRLEEVRSTQLPRQYGDELMVMLMEEGNGGRKEEI